MILQALVQYYEALLARGEIDRPGWSKVNVSWRLDLNPDGSLFDVSPLQRPSPNGKKMLPQQFAVPAQVKRSSGVAANFLCDTSSYLLGVDDKGKPERTKACFEASREKPPQPSVRFSIHGILPLPSSTLLCSPIFRKFIRAAI